MERFSSQVVSKDPYSTMIEGSSLGVLSVVLLVVIVSIFFGGCGQNPMAPTRVAEAIDLRAYIIFQGEFNQALDDSVGDGVGQAKKGKVLNIALVGDSGQPFFEEASSVLEMLDELYLQFDVRWIRYTPGYCEPGWCDDQALYERLARKAGFKPEENPVGFLIWDNKGVVFLSPVAPPQVLQFIIDNW